MANKTRTILFVLIGLGILAMIAYGYISSKKLEEQKITEVDSNIDDFLYDESKEEEAAQKEEEAEEEFDGAEVVDEDDDFEVYEEEGDDWGTTETPEPTRVESADDELEELYDPTKEKKKEAPAPAVKKEPEVVEQETTSSSESKEKYLVVVGSFKSKRNANKKLAALEKTGTEGSIIQLQGSKLQTVIAGQFSKESEAEDLAQRLKEEHDLSAFVKARDD